MERLQEGRNEITDSVEKPVALLHSYLRDREGKGIPDRLSRLVILAAAELYRRGKIGKVCITVEPELSALYVKRLKTVLGLSGEDKEDLKVKALEDLLVVVPRTVTTAQEVQAFKEISEENDWNNLITIGNHAHLPRIQREIKKRFRSSDKKIEARSSGEILSRYPRYESILEEMEMWPEQHSLAMQERILNIPVLGNLALCIAPRLSHVKIALQSWGLNQIERNRF